MRRVITLGMKVELEQRKDLELKEMRKEYKKEWLEWEKWAGDKMKYPQIESMS